MDEIFNLVTELAMNGYARSRPKQCLNAIYAETLQDGQYSAEAHQAAVRLAKFLPTYGTWTIEQIINATPK